jgi:hypothetical protein
MFSAHHRPGLSTSGRARLLSVLPAGFLAALASGLAHAGNPCTCAADLNTSGWVDAADLAILLGHWGTGDPEADLNESGTVNAADLSILLGAWGPCGTPENDLCSDATVLPSLYWQDVPFCTLNATTDGPANAACDASGSDQIFDDVWFRVTSPTDGMLHVTTCGSTFDTRLAVYKPGLFGVTCPSSGLLSASIVGCNDDSLTCNDVLNSAVLVPAAAGETYTIRAGGYQGAIGTGSISVDFYQKGDLIEDAIPVDLTDNGGGVTQILSGNTLHATPSADPNPNSCGGVNDTKDLWFKVHVNCANGGAQPVDFSVSTCMPGTAMDTTLTVYSGTVGNLTEIECNDDYDMPSCEINGFNRKSFVSFDPQSSNAIYWVRLAGFNGSVGNYEVKFHLFCLD